MQFSMYHLAIWIFHLTKLHFKVAHYTTSELNKSLLLDFFPCLLVKAALINILYTQLIKWQYVLWKVSLLGTTTNYNLTLQFSSGLQSVLVFHSSLKALKRHFSFNLDFKARTHCSLSVIFSHSRQMFSAKKRR